MLGGWTRILRGDDDRPDSGGVDVQCAGAVSRRAAWDPAKIEPDLAEKWGEQCGQADVDFSFAARGAVPWRVWGADGG